MQLSMKAALLVTFALAASPVVDAALAASDAKISHLAVTSAGLAHGFSDTNLFNSDGCTGGNLSPALSWSGAPAGTKSFIVTLYDPDDRDSPSGWWHWVVYDIPAGVTELRAGAGVEQSTKLPAGAHQGRTDLGTLAYHGPCPDKGDKPHGYTFTVYALDVAKLPVNEGSSGAMVVETAHEHLLSMGTLVIHHGR
jgi:Raf kinase inhibitor-like YbhB/YbcL family protein